MDNSAPSQSQEPVQRSSRVRWLATIGIVLLIIAPVGMYAWYYRYNTCDVKAVEEASVFLVTQLKTYDDLYQVATTASRTAVPHPVIVLQQIFMDTQEVDVPACLRTAKNELLNYMGTVITAFQAFIATEKDPAIRGLLDQSNTHYRNFRMELEAVDKCAPFCAPWD
jgi:hypothetical protein